MLERTILWRRRAVGRTVCVLALLLSLAGLPVMAQDFPSKEIRVYCGFPPGGGADISIRFFAEKLRALSGRPVIVENKTGAGGNLAVQAITRAKPDGYSLVISTGGPASYNVHLFKNLGYDPVKELAPISPLASFPFVLVVNPELPIKTVADLVAHAKARGGKTSYGAIGGTPIVLSEMMKYVGKFDATQVMYRGAGSPTNDLLSGVLDFMFMDSAAAIGQAQQGRLRILAVSTPTRSSVLPDVPTLIEGGLPGVERTSWFAAFAPPGTPEPIVQKLNGWFQQILAMDDTKQFLHSAGADPFPGTPEDLRRLQLDEIAKWADLVKLAQMEAQ
jgi:tripartite-type tricarboxylate transporter receptor subunit TctC